MTKHELQEKLDALGISRDAYSLEGGVHDNKYVISQEPMRKWSVYYSEKGLVIGKRLFDKESDACEYFFNKVVSDPTVKQRGT
jgi:hypothetical protein